MSVLQCLLYPHIQFVFSCHLLSIDPHTQLDAHHNDVSGGEFADLVTTNQNNFYLDIQQIHTFCYHRDKHFQSNVGISE